MNIGVRDEQSVIDETLVHLRGLFGGAFNVAEKEREGLAERLHGRYRIIIGVDHSSTSVNKFRMPFLKMFKESILKDTEPRNAVSDNACIAIDSGAMSSYNNGHGNRVECFVTYLTLNQEGADLLIHKFTSETLRQEHDKVKEAFFLGIGKDGIREI